MRGIALSLLLLFTSFTVVLSTYYLWQDGDVLVMAPLEEEEEEGHLNTDLSSPFFLLSFKETFDDFCESRTDKPIGIHLIRNYEDVQITAPFSPPDLV